MPQLWKNDTNCGSLRKKINRLGGPKDCVSTDNTHLLNHNQ